jgi:deazaflavin-dependent oxidoreductase (nitroreductase family)
MNYIANPVVRLILRSPLHGMLSPYVLLIRYRGRKSGKTHTLPVQYVESGNAIYILPSGAEHKTWWRNLKGDAPLEILLRGQRLQAEGGLLVGQADLELISEALGLYLQRFPGLVPSYRVHRKPDGSLDADELRKAAASLIMVRVRLQEASSPGPEARS